MATLLRVTAITFLFTYIFGQLNAQQFSAIFRASDAKMEYAEALPWESFVIKADNFSQQGYRLTNIETTGKGKDRKYWGVFTESALKDTLVKVTNWPDFVKAKRAMAKAGYLLAVVQAYAISETDAHYLGVWYKDGKDTPHKIWKLDSSESLTQKTEEMAKIQYYIQEVETFLSPSGTATYLAIYHYSPIPVRNYVAVQTDSKTFTTDLWQRTQSNVRLIDFEHFDAKDGAYYLGVYQPGTYEAQFISKLEQASFNGKWEQLEKENLQLVSWEIRD